MSLSLNICNKNIPSQYHLRKIQRYLYPIIQTSILGLVKINNCNIFIYIYNVNLQLMRFVPQPLSGVSIPTNIGVIKI